MRIRPKKIKNLAAAVFYLFVAGLAEAQTAESFHAGGAGSCKGCHTIHNSQEGVPFTGPGVSQWLLRGPDPSSICLNCHAGQGGANSYSVFSADGSAMTPGGDFYWLTKTFSWIDGTSPGASHGHNIIAQDYNLFIDPENAKAPGGTYPSSKLSCISCHDPHGKVMGGTPKGTAPVFGSGSYGEQGLPNTTRGNYRLLGDSHYNGGSQAQGFSFTNNAPVAKQNSTNKYEESAASHVDYGAGMSEWCGNCHIEFVNNKHNETLSGFEHPAGNNEKLESAIINNYNSYLKTGDLSGSADTAYLQFAPFERGTTDSNLLDPLSKAGPDANSNVMCLTCHRAHASAFRASGRWDFDAPLLANSHPALGDAGATGNDVFHSYYGRDIVQEFGSGQGPFCEKCHEAGGP